MKVKALLVCNLLGLANRMYQYIFLREIYRNGFLDKVLHGKVKESFTNFIIYRMEDRKIGCGLVVTVNLILVLFLLLFDPTNAHLI